MYEENKESNIRVKRISLYLNSNGVLKILYLLPFMFLTFEIYIYIFLFLEEKLISNPHLGILEVHNNAGGAYIRLQKYIIFHFIDNTLMGDINRYFNSNVYIKHYVDYDNFLINLTGYIVFFLSAIFTLFSYSLSFIQIKDQKRYTDINFYGLYSPKILIPFSIFVKKYHYVKIISEIRNDNMTKNNEKDFIKYFFKNDEIYLKNDIEIIKLKYDKIELFWGIYPVTRYYLEI